MFQTLQLPDVPETSMIYIALSVEHSIVQKQSKILRKIYVRLYKFYFISDFLVDRYIIQIPFANLKKNIYLYND